MNELASFQAWTQENRVRIKETYFQFLRFKSISSDPSMKGEMQRCCAWVVDLLKKIGFDARSIETSGAPLVYAENLHAGKKAPTVLIYGHYDVQPVDPIELWESDPFEPEQRGQEIYARGANDDKGQILFAILAFQMMKELKRQPPVNIKFCIEGEEESGSSGLSDSLPKLKTLLKADELMVVDCGLSDKATPAITLGGRGIMTLEVTLSGSKIDLHSGLLGGIAYNPNRALVELLAKLWDEEGRVAIPHFYDAVVEMKEGERKQLQFHHDRSYFIREFGIEAFSGEKGRSMMDAAWLRPTIEINGLSGGYSGPGFKTVIPKEAKAKLSCRLVPDQDPAQIEKLVADFLTRHVKEGMKVDVKFLGSGSSFRGRLDSPLAKTLAQAYTEIMKKPCEAILSGGSIPIIAELSRFSQAQVVGMGYGLPEDQIHAPNEHYGLDRLEKGIWTVARAVELLG